MELVAMAERKNKMSITDSIAARGVEGEGPRPFMDCFYALADLDASVRHKAALDVCVHLQCDGKTSNGPGGRDNVAYAIKRLVRGLGSSRGCARQGFLLALVEVLRLRVDGGGIESTKKKSEKR